MKNISHLLLFSVLFSSCNCNSCTDIDACQQSVSTEYLLEIRNVDYTKVAPIRLKDPHRHAIEVCGVHFGVNTDSYRAYKNASDEIKRQYGSKLQFAHKFNVPHKEPFDFLLHKDNMAISLFDYLDMDLDLPARCNVQTNQDFNMLTCLNDIVNGETEHFFIMVNSDRYEHYNDLDSDEYPEAHGIMHELMHAAGMKHTKYWDSKDTDYISTMQGNLEYLSAFDVSFMRDCYPEPMNETINYVVSSLSRFDGKKTIFDDFHSDQYHFSSNGELEDCYTHQSPEFRVAWFNTGNIDTEQDKCGVNKLYLRKKTGSKQEIALKTWRMADMPYLSQDQWKGELDLQIDDPESIDCGDDWELVFEVNAWKTLNEDTFEDNVITKDVSVYYNICTCSDD